MKQGNTRSISLVQKTNFRCTSLIEHDKNQRNRAKTTKAEGLQTLDYSSGKNKQAVIYLNGIEVEPLIRYKAVSFFIKI